MQPAMQFEIDESGEPHGIDGDLSEEDKAFIRQHLATEELKEATTKTRGGAASILAIAEPVFVSVLKRADRLKGMGYSLDANGELVTPQ